MVFNESTIRKSRLTQNRMFLLYDEVVEEVSESVHAGITLNAHFNNNQRIHNSVLKTIGGV